MGYTHYWTIKKDTPKEKLSIARGHLHTILQAYIFRNPGILAGGSGDVGSEPEIGRFKVPEEDCVVCFNGIGEESHESFFFSPDPDDYKTEDVFSFCKTARKPYDAAVTACLLMLKLALREYVEISSDGYSPGDIDEDFQKGADFVLDFLRKNVTVHKNIKLESLISKGR